MIKTLVLGHPARRFACLHVCPLDSTLPFPAGPHKPWPSGLPQLPQQNAGEGLGALWKDCRRVLGIQEAQPKLTSESAPGPAPAFECPGPGRVSTYQPSISITCEIMAVNMNTSGNSSSGSSTSTIRSSRIVVVVAVVASALRFCIFSRYYSYHC